MAHALPVTKLAGLLLKTLAKPVAKRIKHEASRRPMTRNMLVGIGQLSHQFTSRLTIWSAGYKVRSITPLEEEKALSTGAEFLSESFLLIVSGGIVIWEYQRSKVSQQSKDEKHRAVAKAERMALQAKLHALDVRVKALEVVVKQNSESILNIGGAKYVAPQDTVPIDDDDDEDNDGKDSEDVVQKIASKEHAKDPHAMQVVEKIKRILPKSKEATPASDPKQPPELPQQQIVRQAEPLTNASSQPSPNSNKDGTSASATDSSEPHLASPAAAPTKPWWQFW